MKGTPPGTIPNKWLLYHLQSHRRREKGGLCSCCIPVSKALKTLHSMCLNRLLKGVTGLNKIERTLAGVSVLDLLLYHPPSPSHVLDNVVIKRTELLIRHQLCHENSNIKLLQMGSLTSEQLEAEAQVLSASLQLRPKYIPVLTVALEQIGKAHMARQAIIDFQQMPFDSNNPQHVQTLTLFWLALMDGVPLPQRNGMLGEATTSIQDGVIQHTWSDVGFQSEPSRDFRGAGYLGALNLLWFAEKHRLRARQVLAQANSTESRLWFPFAATGLNVTVWLLALMNEGHLDVFFYTNPRSPMETFNVIYSFVFLEFTRFWHLSRATNIMQFGDVSGRFLKKIEKTLSEMSDQSYHSEWSVPMTSTGDELIEELRCWIDGEVPTHRGIFDVPHASSQLIVSQPTSASRLVARLSAVS